MAATAKPAAAPASASGTAIATRSPPTGGPTKEFMTVSAAKRRPLAVTSRSRPTSAGRIDWALVSKKASPAPMMKAPT